MSLIQQDRSEIRQCPGDHRPEHLTFTMVSFPTLFPQGSQVVVCPLTQTFNDPETPGIHIHDITNTGFLIRLNEVVAGAVKSDGKHTIEIIGWLAATV